MFLLIVRAVKKSSSAASPAEVKAKLAPWTPLPFPYFPSVCLSGQRQTTTLRQRWMEVVNSRWGRREQDRRREREKERERCIVAHITSDRMTDEGDYGAELRPTVTKVREPPRTIWVETEPITLLDWVKLSGQANTFHFTQWAKIPLLKFLHC